MDHAERSLVGCIYAQRDAAGSRLAAAANLTPDHFDDPLCAALFRAAVEHADDFGDTAPILSPEVLATAERHAGRPLEIGEIDDIVDLAPPTAYTIPELAAQIRARHAARAAANAARAALDCIDGRDPEAAAAALRSALRALEEQAPAVRTPIPLADVTRPPEAGDELLRDRFLCRGGAALLVGPTGAGKSSLAMQAAILWALGVAAFGLMPARPLRVLIVQAENDDGDLAEMRDGVLRGLTLRDKDAAAALANVRVITEDTRTREAFAAWLRQILKATPTDLLIVDPAFAYLGGDASNQRDVSPFLRNMLNPILHEHNVGLVLVHHANKPQQPGQQKAAWNHGDFAYLGAGSAEWANWARAVIALRATSDPALYEFMAAKRGRRAGWTDDNGHPTTRRYVAYHREPGLICWERITDAEASARLGRGAKATVQDVVNVLGDREMGLRQLRTALIDATGIGKTWAEKIIEQARDEDVIRAGSPGPRGLIPLRASGRLQPQNNTKTAMEDSHE